MNPGEFDALLTAVEQYILDHPPISLHQRHARQQIRDADPSRSPTTSWPR
jgi:hypothetical protein